MRVIAGIARHITLDTLPGFDTRPTTDRIKETLFNMIHNDLPGCDFLDIFAGSGAIGIEALSRGAQSAVFIENSKAAADIIKGNLAKTRLEGGRLLTCDYLAGLMALENENKVFDIIFMDPPYDHEFEKKVLEYLAFSRLVYSDTMIITEASLNTDMSYLSDLGFTMVKEKRYKTNKHCFIKKADRS